MQIDKNGKLPETYWNFPCQYTRLNFGVMLRKNNDEIFLQGDDEAQFFYRRITQLRYFIKLAMEIEHDHWNNFEDQENING